MNYLSVLNDLRYELARFTVEKFVSRYMLLESQSCWEGILMANSRCSVKQYFKIYYGGVIKRIVYARIQTESVPFRQAIENAMSLVDVCIDSALQVFNNAVMDVAQCMGEKKQQLLVQNEAVGLV